MKWKRLFLALTQHEYEQDNASTPDIARAQVRARERGYPKHSCSVSEWAWASETTLVPQERKYERDRKQILPGALFMNAFSATNLATFEWLLQKCIHEHPMVVRIQNFPDNNRADARYSQGCQSRVQVRTLQFHPQSSWKCGDRIYASAVRRTMPSRVHASTKCNRIHHIRRNACGHCARTRVSCCFFASQLQIHVSSYA